MANFKNAKVGDEVYSLRFGQGNICIVDDSAYPIKTAWNSLAKSYTFDGKLNIDDVIPDLYHSKPEIIEAKRMVKKSFDLWFNIYGNKDVINYNSEKEANEEPIVPDRLACIKKTFEYEVEE